MKNVILSELMSHKKTIDDVVDLIQEDILKASKMAVSTLKNKRKIILCGNGGSAADAQHIAAELTGRYKCKRAGLPAIAITTDTSAITAIGNDYGYDRVFDRQVESICQEGDLLIAISTSGNSQNIINAILMARKYKANIISFTGNDGGKMKSISDVNVVIPSSNTPRIQEMHILVGHIMCQIIDDNFGNL